MKSTLKYFVKRVKKLNVLLKNMEIVRGIEIVGKHGIFLAQHRALVIADLHIGYEAALEKQGIMVPCSQYPKMKQDIANMLNACKPEMLIINGDVKHEFGEATRQEWGETLDLLSFLEGKKLKLVVVRGNHDNFLIPILKKHSIELKDPCFMLGNFLFFHGHKQLDLQMFVSAENLIMAHEHPAIVLRDELGVKRKFKCFLKGRFHGKNLIVLPAFSPLAEGSEVNLTRREELLSPLLRACNLASFKAVVLEDRKYEFPLSAI